MKQINLAFQFWVIFSFICSYHLSAEKVISKSYASHSLPKHVLVFPKLSADHRHKILASSGVYKIWEQKKINAWAKSQGFDVTQDTPADNWQFRRAAVFQPPGMQFQLQIDTTEKQNRLGWVLFLDMGFLKKDTNKAVISTNFKNYSNILRYEIFIDYIHFKTIEIGYGKTLASPLKLRLPFVRDRDGRILIDIKLANHADNFGILYDAFLVKEMR